MDICEELTITDRELGGKTDEKEAIQLEINKHTNRIG